MDSRQQTQQYANNSGPHANGNFSFNAQQNDAFNAFVNVEEGPSYDPSWANQNYPSHASNIDGYDQNGQAWQQNPYQNPNLLSIPNYAVPPRDYEQSYSRNPPPYDYQAFEPDPSQVFSNSGYNSTLDFGQNSLHERYGYTTPGHFAQANDTISPQALQNYAAPHQELVPQARQLSNRPPDSGPLRTAAEPVLPQVQPLTRQEWINLTSPNAASIYRGGLHIKPTETFSNATNSTRLDGFVFIGNDEIALTIGKASVPRQTKRKSRNELMRFLEREKGDAPWHRDREPLIKRLKDASIKLAGPKPVPLTPSSRPGSTTEDASSSDSPDSETEEDSQSPGSDAESESEEPSPVPLTRPADPNKAKEYDLIKTVWAKRRTVLSPTVIRTALAECWDIFKDIRDKWKVKLANLQQAIDKKDTANKGVYERRVLEQRKLLESCIRLTLKHGHPSIVEKLGESPQLLVVFYQFLADRFKDGEYSGSFIASILELIAQCNSVDAPLLEKTKFDKLLSRLVKKGDEEVKKQAQNILNSAVALAKKPKVSDTSDAKAQPNGNMKKEQAAVDAADAARPTANDHKRSNESEKKGSKVLSSGKNVVSSHGGADVDAAKVKVVQSAAKPSNFFAGLQSASKKPGTATKGKEGRPSAEPTTKSEEIKPPPKPAFSFAATMANLAKQKETPQTKAEDVKKSETPEERRKRIRKEQRRGLRVSFKSDGELVQIREFIHDPEEDMGHEASQVRDVGDSKGEGQVLKMHKDLDLMDEDEDYEPPEEIEAPPIWVAPTQTDFSVIEEDELARNYKSRGGQVDPESTEQNIQQQRESSTLMVIYSNLADIPPTSREPIADEMEVVGQEQKFGEASDLVKEREAEYRANRYSIAPPAAPATQDIGSLLRILNGQGHNHQPSQPVPQVQPAPSAASVSLQALLAHITNNNQSTPQQAPMVSPIPQPSAATTFNLQATLSTIARATQSQQPYVPQPGYASAPPSQGTPDLQAILAQINPQRQAQGSQNQVFGITAGSQQNDNDRKRAFDSTEPDDFGGGKKAKAAAQADKKKYIGVPRLPCRYWQEGKCRKGDECTFLHE